MTRTVIIGQFYSRSPYFDLNERRLFRESMMKALDDVTKPTGEAHASKKLMSVAACIFTSAPARRILTFEPRRKNDIQVLSSVGWHFFARNFGYFGRWIAWTCLVSAPGTTVQSCQSLRVRRNGTVNVCSLVLRAWRDPIHFL